MAYYDVMLYMSTEEYPNTMGITATLTERVDGDILRETVEELRERFPYYYVRAAVEGNDLAPVPNPLPVTVRNTWEPIMLHSAEANYHLMAFKYEGDRLAVEISHAVTDGAGLLPYFRSILYLYLSRKTGKTFDPAGFRLPGSSIPETEIGDPFPGIDVDSAEAPLYQKPPVTDYYRLSETQSGEGMTPQILYVRLPEEEVMRHCRENDGSPNVLLAVLLARAVRIIDPESEKTVVALVAIDHKALLGNRENYRQFANTAYIDFPRARADEDILKMCTAGRGQIMLQAQPENTLFYLKMRKAGAERMSQAPLQMKVDRLKQAVGAPRATVGVSYANSRSFGPLDPYIRELYILGEPGVTDILCEVACINHHFFLALSRTFTSEAYCQAFFDELNAAGIPYEIMRKEPYRLCGVRYDGVEGVNL